MFYHKPLLFLFDYSLPHLLRINSDKKTNEPQIGQTGRPVDMDPSIERTRRKRTETYPSLLKRKDLLQRVSRS